MLTVLAFFFFKREYSELCLKKKKEGVTELVQTRLLNKNSQTAVKILPLGVKITIPRVYVV